MLLKFTPSRFAKKYSGFGLIELLVTITIFAILLAIATPNFSDILSQKDLNSASTTLVQALNKAKRIARSESTRVTVTVTGSTVTLVKDNTANVSEKIHLPSRISTATTNDDTASSVVVRFNADGLVLDNNWLPTNNTTNIVINSKSNSNANKTISISSLGMIAAL